MRVLISGSPGSFRASLTVPTFELPRVSFTFRFLEPFDHPVLPSRSEILILCSSSPDEGPDTSLENRRELPLAMSHPSSLWTSRLVVPPKLKSLSHTYLRDLDAGTLTICTYLGASDSHLPEENPDCATLRSVCEALKRTTSTVIERDG